MEVGVTNFQNEYPPNFYWEKLMIFLFFLNSIEVNMLSTW